MQKPLFSEQWYRVKDLRPRLRRHIRLYRHDYRGEIWFVMADAASSLYYRFNRSAYQVIAMMDGERTIQQIWEQLNTQLGDEAPVQDDIIHLLGQLHQMDALQSDIPPDITELSLRGEEQQRRKKQHWKNPLSMRIRLIDPDQFLEATLPLVRGLFSRTFLGLWCLLVVFAALLVGLNWQEILAAVRQDALVPANLWIPFLVYPFIKLLHELAHGYAVKLQGGEVHEMGVVFLVFVPVPYVDASASAAFRQRHLRVLVGAAGIMVELLLAALALFLWLLIEPGLVRSVCLNIALIGGVSTLLFNGNPLLRFDGYYVLADAIGIPGLAQRANQYLAYLVQRYLFGLGAVESPVRGSGESPWLIGYGIASYCYRLLILAVICFFLVEYLFVLGILLAVWAIYSQIGLPLWRMLRFLMFSPALNRHRQRAVLVSLGFVALLAGLLMLLPVSSLSRFEGVIWPPEESQLVSGTECFFEQVLAPPGSSVSAGQPLIRMRNLRHLADIASKRARMAELASRSRAALVSDRVQTQSLQEEMVVLQGELDRLQEKIDALVITSPVSGRFILPLATDFPGKYLEQGQLLGYVLEERQARVRVVVTQEHQDRITQRLDAIEIRMASGMGAIMPGRLIRAMPQASHQLPSNVLSIEGGGPFTPDSSSAGALSTREPVFEYEIEVPIPVHEAKIGSRVYVRFDHGDEVLWSQLTRRLRQLFIRRLNV